MSHPLHHEMMEALRESGGKPVPVIQVSGLRGYDYHFTNSLAAKLAGHNAVTGFTIRLSCGDPVICGSDGTRLREY
jgi:hypothetical protein